MVLAPRTLHVHWFHLDAPNDASPMRNVLSRYCEAEPEQLKFQVGRHGKPFLPDHPALGFNWSHSGLHAVLAVGRDIDVGVDIELKSRKLPHRALARRFYCHSEIQLLDPLGDNAARLAFLRLWTAKEAVLKTLGQGLQGGIDRVEVGLGCDDQVRLLSCSLHDTRSNQLQLRSLDCPDPNLLASIAWCGDIDSLTTLCPF